MEPGPFVSSWCPVLLQADEYCLLFADGGIPSFFVVASQSPKCLGRLDFFSILRVKANLSLLILSDSIVQIVQPNRGRVSQNVNTFYF